MTSRESNLYIARVVTDVRSRQTKMLHRRRKSDAVARNKEILSASI